MTLLGLLLLGAGFFAQQSVVPQPVADPDVLPTFVVPNVARKLRLIAYGDVRFTNPSDHARSDPAVRRALVQKIAEERPDALLFSGDLPYRGGKNKDWEVVDAEIRPLWDAHIRIYPALGNHEYAGGESQGLINWWKRFPDLKGRRWYSVLFGNCFFITLDSNSALAPGTAQDIWLNKQLTHLPTEADFIFFNLHHPPHTDSRNHWLPGLGHAARDQERSLAARLESLQPRLRGRLVVIAGHVHNYERFEHASVTYIVSGGGGATPYLLERSPDDKYQSGRVPTFNYVVLEIDGPTLKGRMMKLEEGGPSGRFEVRDSFELRAVPLVFGGGGSAQKK